MDLEYFEADAKTSALRQVAQMLQRPDQLEKLDTYKKRTERKKAAVEAMLKTAVQSQLEGVKKGLNQLQSAAEDVKTIGEHLEEAQAQLHGFAPLKDKLSKLREENRKHSQYAAAMENLKHIFNVPETIEKTHELITDGNLLPAHKNLMELETARDDLMFEVHKLQSQSEYDKNLMKSYFSEVEKLAQELAKQLWYILGRTLEAVRGADPGPQQVVTVLRIIAREERIDVNCMKLHKETGFMPVGRPRNWKEKCFQILENVVRQRIEGNQLEDRSLNKQWLARYLETCRQVVVGDLRVAKGGAVSCFPPEDRIYERFVRMYHLGLSDRVREIASDDLEKNELFQILTWLKTYSSEEMLGHPFLQIDTNKLLADQPLLPKTTISQLMDRFLDLTRKDLQEWLERTLHQEKDDWYKATAPEQDSMGHFYSALPTILYQMVDDQVKLGREISLEIIPGVLLVTIDELLQFTMRFREAFLAFKNKHFEDRSRFRSFTSIIISAANNCAIFMDSTDKLKKHVRLTVEAEMQTPRGASQRQELLGKIDQLKEKWNGNEQLAIICLLEEVLQDLNPHLTEVMTKKWANDVGGGSVETICATIDDYYGDHRHLKPPLLATLLMELQFRVLQEYLKALETRRLSFGNLEDRKAGGQKFERNGKQLENLFNRLVPGDEEAVVNFEMMTDVLGGFAEFLSLSDKSLLSLEMSGFVRKFPDVTVEQLSGLCQLREDVGRSEARQSAQEILDQNKYRPKQMTPYTRLFRPKTEAEKGAVYQTMEYTAHSFLLNFALGATQAADITTN